MSWIWVSTLNKSAYYTDFWRSCHTEDWSNDAENTALITFEHQCISIHTYKCVFSESALNFLWWRRRNRKLMNQTLTDRCLGNTVPLTRMMFTSSSSITADHRLSVSATVENTDYERPKIHWINLLYTKHSTVIHNIQYTIQHGTQRTRDSTQCDKSRHYVQLSQKWQVLR